MDTSQVRAMKVVLLLSSLATLFVLGGAAYRENFEGRWRVHQDAYKTLLLDTADNDMAKRSAQAFTIEPKQLYLPELNTIDRCTTCHLGIENPAAANIVQPLRKHSGDILVAHSPEKFGCTICHQGQGRASTKESAHGWLDSGESMPHVDTPLLRGEAVYTSCGLCHDQIDLYGGTSDLYAAVGEDAGKRALLTSIDEASLSRSLPGADVVTRGKRLTVSSGCLGCHQYRGRGGMLGPDLTYVGDKIKHDFDFSHVSGQHTVEQWLFEHFKFPREVSPSTIMPDLGLSDGQARDLALYMMSLHRKDAPASHTPPPSSLDRGSEPVRGETLYAMFCAACHGPDGAGTTMREGLWPNDADPWGRDWDATNIVTEQRGDMEVMVPSLNHGDTLAVVSDDYLRRIISQGRPGTKMLGWANEGGLGADEITLLVDYVRSWDRPTPDMASISASRGDSVVGAALYRANCAACHGRSGEGGIGNSLNSPTFLAVASDAFLRDTIVHGRPNTAMPSWREFDSQEISDLLAFLRAWQPQRSHVLEVVALSEGGDTSQTSKEIGRILFKANCVMCHGSDGQGDLAPSLNTQAFLTIVSDDYLAQTLVEGRPGTGMPSWRHLSSEDIASILLYVRTWQIEPSNTSDWHDQNVPRGDWDAGKNLFAGHCSGCHGTDAEGATGPQLNNPVFLRTASDVMLREWIMFGKEGTEMRSFRKGGQGIAELSDRQIEDIVSYLRRLEQADDGEISRVAKSPHGRPEKGAVIYAVNCIGCHGTYGEGASGPALSNQYFLRYASDGFLMATMAMGRLGTEMRPVKRSPQAILGLTSDEVNDVVAFMRSWEHTPPVMDTGYFAEGEIVNSIAHRFVIPWNLEHGRELFASNCSGCHGVDGFGSWAPELNNEGFLAAATDGFLQATIVRGRKGTAMRPFGDGAQGVTDLSSQDVDDIVAFIRQWSKLTPSPMTIPAQQSLTIPSTNKTEQQLSRMNEERKVKNLDASTTSVGSTNLNQTMAAVSLQP